jgi:ParB-like chromosome segregation protein Spo0J
MTSNLILERPAEARILERPAEARPPLAANSVVANAVAAADPSGGNAELMRMAERAPVVSVPVASLIPGFMLRQAGTDAAHVRLLADAAGSVELPPIMVQKRGSRIIDGMHRVEVAKLRGEWSIKARVVDCTDQQALVLAVRANTLHGLPLSRADRIAGAKRILGEHADWSDRAVAAITGLSAKAVASVRNNSVGDMQFRGKRLGRDGKRRPVQAGEGRRRAAEYITAHPEASLRQVARETDVSVGTVHDVRERLRRGTLTVPDAPTRPDAAPRQDAIAAPQAPTRPAGPGSPLQLARSLPDHGGPGRPCGRDTLQPIWSAIAAKLASDPALRYTVGGRAFLRWMAQHSAQGDEWREFIDAIPGHWRDEVGRIARGMSDEWRQFADQLQGKQGIAS